MLAHRLRRASQKDTGPVGQSAYTTAGTYSWVCPANVTSVCVVCVGPGGYRRVGGNTIEQGRPGGGLGWKNSISVTPGASYTVRVGAVGTTSVIGADKNGSPIYGYSNGTDSFFISALTVCGKTGDNGGTFVGDGGGNGGSGGSTLGGSYARGGGGGGAGGYSGNGGNGSNGGTTVPGAAGGNGSAGGGGGGSGARATGVNHYNGGRGGGVGILGQGANGAGGAAIFTINSSGNVGGNGSDGAYGKGAAGGISSGGIGSSVTPTGGAVRIIWGAGRAFPSTRTGDET